MADEKAPGKSPNNTNPDEATELDRLGISPTLDNRTGRHRPPNPEDQPLKPQQVHGGYPGDDDEAEDPPSGKPVDRNRSEGPHGRGPQSGPSSED